MDMMHPYSKGVQRDSQFGRNLLSQVDLFLLFLFVIAKDQLPVYHRQLLF
jgi:hypothetical protein